MGISICRSSHVQSSSTRTFGFYLLALLKVHAESRAAKQLARGAERI